MYKRLSLVSVLALGSAFLLGNGLSNALAQEKTIAEMVPKSGWSVARIDANAPESYCALSRQYHNGLVLTLGRNETEEYSLAIDFQAVQLNTEKAYSLTLQPGPGQIRAYEMMPASKSAMVIRLGYDDSFFAALEKSNLLKVEIDGTNYHFQVPDFSTGKADLSNCLSGLKGKSKTKVASGFSAKKIADAPPIKMIKAEAVKIARTEATKLVESIKVAPKPATVVELAKPIEAAKITPKMVKPSKPVFIEKIEKVPEVVEKALQKPEVSKPIEITRIETKQAAPKIKENVKMARNVVRSNNDALLQKTLASKQGNVRPAKQVSKQVKIKPSNVSVGAQTALQKKQRDALEQLKADNERLNKALQAEVRTSSVRTPDRSGEVSALQNQLGKLQSELATAKNKPNVIDQQLKTDVEKLREENEQLKLSMQAQEKAQAQKEKEMQAMAIQAQAKKAQAEKVTAEAEAVKIAERVSKPVETQQKTDTVDPDVMRQLDNLKTENTRLSAALQGQGEKLTSFDTSSPAAKSELAAIRSQLHELQLENKKIYEQARLTRGNVDTAVAATSNQALRKMREYENKLGAAQSDNRALSKEIEELRRMQEDGRLSAVSGDWDLEKSTKRYNEAEREIKRLGMLMEQQRMSHRQEKAELEEMLFDPAVTDREQRRRLSDLEMQLADAEKELQRTGGTLPQRRRIPLSPVDERVTLGSLTPNPIISQQRENLEIQRLNNKVARQNRQLQAYNSAQRAERMAAVPQPVVRAQPLSAPKLTTPRRPAPTMVEPPHVQSQARAQIQAKPTVSVAPIIETGFGQGQLQKLLSSAGVSLTGKIIKQSAGQYRWSAGSIVGQARIVPKAQAGTISQFAQSYIAKARKSCGGDFASLPSSVGGQGQAFEIACISPSRSTSSSVIFIQKGNELIAISHESSADNMDMTMEARDRVAASL